jgi:hypothetical protein
MLQEIGSEEDETQLGKPDTARSKERDKERGYLLLPVAPTTSTVSIMLTKF